MTHLPFIVATYALGVGIPGIYALNAWRRLQSARRRLAAVDPRSSDLRTQDPAS